MITEITTASEFEQVTAQSLAVIKYWADWCVPCALFAPQYESFADTSGLAQFYSVDVENAPEIMEVAGVRSIPTVQVWSNGAFLGNMKTSNVAALKKELDSYAASL